LLQDKITSWQLSSDDGPQFQDVNGRLETLADALYCDYEPTKGPFPEYWSRLESWINNVDVEEQQKLLFRLAAELFFVGNKELDNLYRVAFNANVTQWIIDQLNLQVDDPMLGTAVADALERTWFCPVTDSMRINAFYHLNHISGRDYRPDWRSLAKLGCSCKLSDFISKKIDRLVLLEDFVGSGSQIEEAIHFLRDLPVCPPTLLIPLIICPAGIQESVSWQTQNPSLTISPVIRLSTRDFLSKDPTPGEPENFADFRHLVNDTFATVLNGACPIETKTYSPFGFAFTGSMIVLATNCPDNTLPLVYHRSGTWRPLFPRASRI
jgi:hypothetical protein